MRPLFTRALAPARFVRRRLGERSTLVGIGTAVAAASVLPLPWSWISLAVGIAASLVPDGKVGDGQ